jgi:hypothetical protein
MLSKLSHAVKEYLLTHKEYIEIDIEQTREKKQKEKSNAPGR